MEHSDVLKDPDTGKRDARPNPKEECIVTEVASLRILDDELWERAKARQAATRHMMQQGLVRTRRPKYLFSGLTKCGECGGGRYLAVLERHIARHLHQHADDRLSG